MKGPSLWVDEWEGDFNDIKGLPGVQGVKAIYTAIWAFRNGGLLSIAAIYDAW
jgi:hypothetical protein